MMERDGDRWEKMEGSCSTDQSPQWAVVPVEEEEECAHHQEKIPYLSDTWYLSLYMDECLVCRAERNFHSALHTRQ
jgi:hypothetical protein